MKDIAEGRLDILREKDGRLLLTDEQKKAVGEKGRILVSASAGSGKTSTMVKRILLGVAEGLSLKKTLVLVYNTSAADELRERLHEGLFNLACTSDGVLRERLRAEIDDLPFCHIGTIHSFCSALIREHFDKLELSPAFDVLDESTHDVYMQKALDAVLADYAEDSVFDNIAEIFSKARREDSLRTNLIKLHRILDIQADKENFLSTVRACFDSFDSSPFMGALKDYYGRFFANALEKLKRNGEDIMTTPLDKYKDAVFYATEYCERQLKAECFEEMCDLARDFIKPALGVRPRNLDERAKAISEVTRAYVDEIVKLSNELSDLADKFEDFRLGHEQNGEYVKKLLEITLAFDAELAKLKRADNVLSFEDLQHYASLLLDKVPSLKGAFDAVYVDEYQDVNPTQEKIISALVGDNCFMVGDVKQSIYGFRLADPGIFLKRLRNYSDNGEGAVIDFNRNFRSSREILAFVNGIFSAVMTEDSADVDFEKEGKFELDGAPDGAKVQIHLFSDRKAESKEGRGLYDIVNSEVSDEDVKGSQYEGKFIADEIKKLVGHALVTGENGTTRTARYGDIAVLFRNRSRGARLIIEQLKAGGIPVEEGAFSKSVSRPEREIITMLRVLDNPRQDIPLAGFLLSCFGGCTESELATVASFDGECFYDKVVACMSTDTPLAKKLQSVMSALDVYRIKASFKNVAELMNGIISDYCYDAYLMRSGEADVYGLRCFVARVAGAEPKSLGRFLDEYCESADGASPIGSGDRVHISTFHGYKGLEIPIAFVADCACDFNFDSASELPMLATNSFIGLRRFDFDCKHKFETLSRLATAKCVKMQQVKEEMRLFYVALTRAKQYMYVSASVSKAEKERFGAVEKLGLAGCHLDFISSAICEGRIDPVVIDHLPVGETERPIAEEAICAPADPAVLDAVLKGREFSYPHVESTRIAMKYSVSALDSDESAVRVFEEGANVGTVYHKVMLYVDFSARGEDGVICELKRMKDENLLTDEEISLVDAKIIARCLDSEIMSVARKAEGEGKCMREAPFMMYKPASDVLGDKFFTKDKVLVQGVIDLFINGDSKILVDFKHSRLDDKKLVERYKTQLYLYKTAIESAICDKIDRVVIYSFLSGGCIDLTF